MRTARNRDARPSASGKPSSSAAASAAHVSAMARSAPLQYGSEVSASQNRWVSKLASTLTGVLLHVTRGNLLLRRQLLERAVLPQRRDRTLQRLAHLLVGLAVVDAEGVLLGEEVGDGQLVRMLPLLVRALGVLSQDCVGAADQQLPDRVGITGIARQIHLRLARRLELVVQGLQVRLV